MNALEFRRIREVLVLAGVLLAIAIAAYAQIQGMKDFPNRREGTNIHKDALQDFVILGVHRNFRPFPRNANLKVRFFIPSLHDLKGTNISVRAIELMDSKHYLMESKESIKWKDGSWNIFEPWPTQDKIDPLTINAMNIGVLATYRAGNDRPVVLPVDVYQNEKELTRSIYSFYFMTAKDLQALEVSVADVHGRTVKLPVPELKCNKRFDVECVKFFSQKQSLFDLDLSLLADGEYHMRLLGHVLNDTTPLTPPEIVLYHHR